MKLEYIGYENNMKLLDALYKNPDNILEFLPPKSVEAFELYQRHFR
jgi:hypothetical protein